MQNNEINYTVTNYSGTVSAKKPSFWSNLKCLFVTYKPVPYESVFGAKDCVVSRTQIKLGIRGRILAFFTGNILYEERMYTEAPVNILKTEVRVTPGYLLPSFKGKKFFAQKN